jgi:hypothetical protein
LVGPFAGWVLINALCFTLPSTKDKQINLGCTGRDAPSQCHLPLRGASIDRSSGHTIVQKEEEKGQRADLQDFPRMTPFRP